MKGPTWHEPHDPLCFGVIRECSVAWKRLFGKNKDLGGNSSASVPAVTRELDGSGIMRRRPPAADPARQSRLDALHGRIGGGRPAAHDSAAVKLPRYRRNG